MNPDDVVGDVIKKGENVIQVRLRRHTAGVLVSAKVHPAVEELMRSWGIGEPQDVRAFGKSWLPGEDPNRPIMIWNMTQNNGSFPYEDGRFRLDMPGKPLTVESQSRPRDEEGPFGEDMPPGPRMTSTPTSTINLSFLRIVGISENAGIAFVVKGVYQLDTLRRVGEQLKVASRRLYVNYLLPIDLTVTVSTQEVR